MPSLIDAELQDLSRAALVTLTGAIRSARQSRQAVMSRSTQSNLSGVVGYRARDGTRDKATCNIVLRSIHGTGVETGLDAKLPIR